MAEIALSIGAKVAEYLVKPAIREGQYFLCVNKVIKNFENEKEELTSERDRLQGRVQLAKESTEVIEEPVEKWLNDVESLLEEVADLEQSMRANTSCFQGRCPTWTRYRLCKQMTKMVGAMGKFKGKSNIEPFSHCAPLPGIQYRSSETFTYFESTKMAYNQLWEALQDDDFYMIGVYGMGGCGKTTLVTEAGKKAEELNMFDKVILITVSQTPNIIDIQGKMAKKLNLKLDEDDEDERAQRLWLSLKEKKRILVIVDDLWRKFDLKDIGIRLDNVDKGAQKILITTRDQQVCISMDCQKKINVGLLSKDESWTLFQKHANIDENFSKLLDGVPRKLCDECKGLPIAIVTVGSSFKGKRKAAWELALDKLRDFSPFDDHEEGVRATLSCLKLSYDHLQNKEAEMVFLMCSMFPEDYNIPIEDLIRYAVGLGVGGRSSLNSKRNSIQAGIDKLLDSCLLMCAQDYYDDCVKMHDMVRDAALWIAKISENHKILVNIDKPLSTLVVDDSMRDCFAVSSWHNECPIFCQLHAPNLEMLLLNINIDRSRDSVDLSDFTFEAVKRLKVFALTRALYSSPLSLPTLSQLFPNVQTLCLRNLHLGDISFIASLTTLEILDLQVCRFNKLPNEIRKLTRLKLLDLSHCRISQENYDGAIGKCSQLEELYVSLCQKEGNHVTDVVTLPKLQRFVILATDMENYGISMRYLGLKDFNISNLRASKENILQRAEGVTFMDLHGGCKNIVPNMVGVVGGMNDLTTLRFDNCPEIECIFNTTSDSKVDDLIPKLVELHLMRMENLKELCRGSPVQVLCYFEKLEILEIYYCEQLHSIFPWDCRLRNLRILKISDTSVEVLFSTSVAQSLQQLEKLVLSNCDKLKHIIASGREEIVSAPRNSHFLMPNLREVDIRGCEKLESIFPIYYVEGLAQLREIKISASSELKYVFGKCDDNHHSSCQYQNHIMLPHLQVIELEDLENFIGMCPECCHAKWPSWSLRIVTVDDCPKLATSWIAMMVGFDQRQHRLNENFPSKLQELCLSDLPQLNFISWAGPTPLQIWSLQCLEVSYCKGLKSLFSMEVYRSLPELMSLTVYNCPELEHIVAANEELVQLPNAEVYFPKLKQIVVGNCDKLKYLFPIAMVRMLTQLSILRIKRAIQLEEVFKHDNRDDTINEVEIVLPNLTDIRLYELPNFVDIYQGYNLSVRELQQINLYKCPKLLQQVTLEEAEGEDEDSLIDSALSDISNDMEES